LQYELDPQSSDSLVSLTSKQARIFDIGHTLEDRAVAWLKDAGFQLDAVQENGQQHGFEVLPGLVRGHSDGILRGGPSFLNYPCLFEFKTQKASSWRVLQKKGLRDGNDQYYVQIQLYMAYLDLIDNPAVFMALNKDTAELYVEAVPFDRLTAQRYSDRAIEVVEANQAGRLLPRLSNKPEFYICKMCPYQKRCFDDTK